MLNPDVTSMELLKTADLTSRSSIRKTAFKVREPPPEVEAPSAEEEPEPFAPVTPEKVEEESPRKLDWKRKKKVSSHYPW